MTTERNKVWRAGRAPQEELDEIDQCRMCAIFPDLWKTCYAAKYCRRQTKMQLGEQEEKV